MSYPHIPVPTVRLSAPTPTANAVLDGITTHLPTTARAIFTLLFDTALSTLQAQGHSQGVSQVVIHQPVEVMCKALSISRVTFYRHLKLLKASGLVDARGHTANWYGLARKTGTVFAVSFRPGHSARLRWFDLKHQWRNLMADTQAGNRTAWKFLEGLPLQSQPKMEMMCRTALEAWAVTPGNTSTTRLSDCKSSLTDTIYSLDLLSSTHKSRRSELIDSYAQALAQGFLDHTNINFWRKLLWDALKRDWEGQGTLYQLQNALTRLMADVEEWGDLRKPGALLVHRLKDCGLWGTLGYA